MSAVILGGQYSTNIVSRQVGEAKAQLVRSQQEATTGTVADPARTLGAEHGRSVSLFARAERLDAIREANGLTALRLDATQASTARFGTLAGDLSARLVLAVGGDGDRTQLRGLATQTRMEMTAALNTTLGGSHLFAGTTTDRAPIAVDTARITLEARFNAAFGHGSDDPATTSIDRAALTAFASDALDHLQNAGWAEISAAAPQTVNARIAPGEVATVSVSADERAFRQGMAAALVTEHLFGSVASNDALAGVAAQTLDAAANAASGTARIEGRLGLVQAQVARADTRLADDRDLLSAAATDIIAVDAFEAAQRFNADVTQLETAYALTSRLQSLSILRFL